MEIRNYTEQWVGETLHEVLAARDDICTCKKCRLDIAAMALNRLKSHYAVDHQGGMYTRTKMLSQQARIDVLAEVLKAVKIVSDNPHHSDPE